MKANPHPLENLLNERQQWVVPVYQRHYSWKTGEDNQIDNLWEDLKDKAEECLDKDRSLYPHFLGAVICSEPEAAQFGAIPERFLIDGQQRITTFNILLVALREYARENDLTAIHSALKSYLFNEESESMTDPNREKFKLWSSVYDRQLFQTIATSTLEEIKVQYPDYFYKNGKTRIGASPKLLLAYLDFLEKIKTYVAIKEEVGLHPNESLDALLNGFLKGFQLVLIELDATDDAQEIFASLNGLAEPLTPFDLIRNDIFLRSKKLNENSEVIFDKQWKELETQYWSQDIKQGRLKRARADHLIAHSVIAGTGRDISIKKIASEYQRYAREKQFPSIAAELDRLLQYSSVYRNLEELPDNQVTTPIGRFLNLLDSSVFHPLIFTICELVNCEERQTKMFQWIESFIIRREICQLTNKGYNKLVPSLISDLRKANDPYSKFSELLCSGITGTTIFPDDAMLFEACIGKQIYGVIPSRRLVYILEKLENSLRSKFDEIKIAGDNLTIEHIMPQKWSDHWALPNGDTVTGEGTHYEDWQNYSKEILNVMIKRNDYIHRIGNLTVLTNSGNPSVGNKGWEAKKAFLAQSLTALNRNLSDHKEWGEDQILNRSRELAEKIIEIWSMPKL